MKALITGAAGFCASYLVARLRRDPSAQIAGLDLQPEANQNRFDRYYRADLLNYASVSSAFSEFRPELVFHIAGRSAGQANSEGVYAVNLMGTVHVLEAALQFAPACRILVTGSAAEYGLVPETALPVTEEFTCLPVGAYGISKYAATLAALDYARHSKLKITVVRPFNIVGAGMPATLMAGAVMARAKQALASLEEPIVRLGDADSERDFIAAEDAVDAYVRLLEADACGEIVNICSGRAWPVWRVAELLLANSMRPIRLEIDPNLAPPSPLRRIYGSYEKAQRLIGFAPVNSLEQALKNVWDGAMGVARCV